MIHKYQQEQFLWIIISMGILILKIIKRILQMLLLFFKKLLLLLLEFVKEKKVKIIGFQSGYQVLNVFPKMFPIALHRLYIRVGLRNESGRRKLFASHTFHFQFHGNVRQSFAARSRFENVEANLSQSVLYFAP
jgi:hypothetical protein